MSAEILAPRGVFHLFLPYMVVSFPYMVKVNEIHPWVLKILASYYTPFLLWGESEEVPRRTDLQNLYFEYGKSTHTSGRGPDADALDKLGEKKLGNNLITEVSSKKKSLISYTEVSNSVCTTGKSNPRH